MGANKIDSYWFSFSSTGVAEIDEILKAVAEAGCKYHHTDGWDEEDIDGNSEILKIQRAVDEAARSFVRLQQVCQVLRDNMDSCELRHADAEIKALDRVTIPLEEVAPELVVRPRLTDEELECVREEVARVAREALEGR